MIDLTEMQEAVNSSFAEAAVCTIATATRSGMPDIALKGSMFVFDTEHLAFWERSKGQTLSNLEENPQACVLYRSRERGVAWKFFGVAELHAEGAMRDQIMARTVEGELNRDPERTGVGVLIRVDWVVQGRNVLQSRD